MIEKAKEAILKSWDSQDFDHLSLQYFNLNDRKSVQATEWHEGMEKQTPNFYWDLASVTKVLGMASLNIRRPELFDDQLRLLLEHRAGLPRWAILGRESWKETVLKFPIKESEVEYSDLSMLRLMLILEEKTGENFQSLVNGYWDKELVFWKDLPEDCLCPDTGFRQGEVINGEVNDDNTFKINRFCSHAGLFATPQGILNSLFNLQEEADVLGKMRKYFGKGKKGEFLYGWRTVMDPQDALAGTNAPAATFGHTGFTGTSVWIDAATGWGWILLTNSTKKYWFNRGELNRLRYKLGAELWQKVK
jgi:CubicO group peptidase (beta-lactamase class C family)